jgi:hypothetical protein
MRSSYLDYIDKFANSLFEQVGKLTGPPFIDVEYDEAEVL